MRRRLGFRRMPLVAVIAGAGLIVTAFVGVGSGSGAQPKTGTAAAPGTFTSGPAAVARFDSVTPAPKAFNSSPIELTLPTLRVAAVVKPVVTTNGVLGVPTDPAQVGWWTGSARPGAASGSVVIDGHVDSAERGVGALFHLTQLKSGDAVTVTTTAGKHFSYRVYERQIHSKRHALPASLFTKAGPSRLVLITCGGPFDPSTGSYQDNVVVLASPIPG